MYSCVYSEKFKKLLKKLSKRDRKTYEQILKKIEEVINSSDIEHYKNLKYDMKELKRVHIGHFVLVFKIDSISKIISFEDYDHHDNIYEK